MVTLKDRFKQLNELKQLTENQPQFVPPPVDESSLFSGEIIEDGDETVDEKDNDGGDNIDPEVGKKGDGESPETKPSTVSNEFEGKESVDQKIAGAVLTQEDTTAQGVEKEEVNEDREQDEFIDSINKDFTGEMPEFDSNSDDDQSNGEGGYAGDRSNGDSNNGATSLIPPAKGGMQPEKGTSPTSSSNREETKGKTVQCIIAVLCLIALGVSLYFLLPIITDEITPSTQSSLSAPSASPKEDPGGFAPTVRPDKPSRPSQGATFSPLPSVYPTLKVPSLPTDGEVTPSAPADFPPSLLPSNTQATPAPTTRRPTGVPTTVPTKNPTIGPTRAPSTSPTMSTPFPTMSPTSIPTKSPSIWPTTSTPVPTKSPTSIPTRTPTTSPTTSPPTKTPTREPTKFPTKTPTSFPSPSPTKNPTQVPTETPSKVPTWTPTVTPTVSPITPDPTIAPATPPPTIAPETSAPTAMPVTPTPPTMFPVTPEPTAMPTTNEPTRSPTKEPSASPLTKRPTASPSRMSVVTLVPTASPKTGEVTSLVQQLEDISGAGTFEDPNSPQSFALDFLRTEGYGDEVVEDQRVLERYAALVFYFSTGGESSWFQCFRGHLNCGSRQWLLGGTCNWQFLSCDDAGYVTSFIVDFDNGLSGSIPIELSVLGELQEFVLVDNTITGLLPEKFTKNASQLKVLRVENSRLEGTIPEGFLKKSPVESLVLSGNRMTGTIPESLYDLTDLQQLYLNENKDLNGKISPSIKKLSKLIKFRLSNTQVGGRIPDEVFELKRIEEIDFSTANFSGPISNSFVSLSDSLNRLYLHSNKFVGTVPAGFGMLSNLNDLTLHENMLSGSVSPTICALNLRILTTSCEEVSCGCCTMCF